MTILTGLEAACVRFWTRPLMSCLFRRKGVFTPYQSQQIAYYWFHRVATLQCFNSHRRSPCLILRGSAEIRQRDIRHVSIQSVSEQMDRSGIYCGNKCIEQNAIYAKH